MNLKANKLLNKYIECVQKWSTQLQDAIFFPQQATDGVQLDITNAIFATKDHPLNQTFQQVSQSFYGVEVLPVDFKKVPQAVEYINKYVKTATKNRITDFVTPGNSNTHQLWQFFS